MICYSLGRMKGSVVVTGTIINVITVLIGGTLGTFLGAALPPRFQEIVMQALGLATLLIGMQMALKTGNPLFPLLGILFGALIGELIGIENALNRLGDYFQRRFSSGGGTFSQGFVTASLVFCVGPITILGSLQNGLNPNDIRLLSVKSVLDGFAAFGFAAAFGPGVLLAALIVLVYQGGLSLSAGLVKALIFSHLSTAQFNAVIGEMTAVGGLMVLAVGLRLLKIAELRVGNFLPALITAPAFALLAAPLAALLRAVGHGLGVR